MHCCNINKSRRGDFFWFTWYKTVLYHVAIMVAEVRALYKSDKCNLTTRQVSRDVSALQ